MQQIIRSAIQARPARTPYFRIPPLLIIVMLLVIGFLLASIIVSRLAKRPGEAYPSEPFAAYEDIFPGQRVDIRQLEAEGFVCQPDSQPALPDMSEHCWKNLQTDSFSQVSVIIWDGIISRLNFAIRENTLTVGDLVVLWGNPEVRINGNLMIVGWPDHHIMASGRSLNGRFTYFQALYAISFEMAT